MAGLRAALPFLLVPAIALAERPNPYIDQARALFENMEFEQCLRRVDQGDRWKNSQGQLAQLELYAGMCALGLGRERDAMDHFQMAVKLDAKIAPPESVGPKVQAVFKKARDKVGPLVDPPGDDPAPSPAPAPPPPPPAPELKQVDLAPSPAPVAPTPAPAADVSATTTTTTKSFNLTPVVLGAAAVVVAGVAVILGVEARSMEQAKVAATFESDAFNDAQQAQSFGLAANIGYGVAGAALIAAVIAWFVLN